MKRLIKLITVLFVALIPAGAAASEGAYTWLMQIGPLQQLQQDYGPAHSPPVIDINHVSVDALVHAVLAASLLIFLAVFPFISKNYYVYVANYIAINIIVVLGLNILVGFTG